MKPRLAGRETHAGPFPRMLAIRRGLSPVPREEYERVRWQHPRTTGIGCFPTGSGVLFPGRSGTISGKGNREQDAGKLRPGGHEPVSRDAPS
jgi:hypothetical protein